MRIALNILGALITLIGIVWILQGYNILPGSFMSGQMKWAFNGMIAAAVGILALLVANVFLKKRGQS